jgi:hypothetical protein
MTLTIFEVGIMRFLGIAAPLAIVLAFPQEKEERGPMGQVRQALITLEVHQEIVVRTWKTS